MQQAFRNNIHPFPERQEAKAITEQPGFKVDAVIDTQIMTAKAFPRDVKRCLQEILSIIEMDEEIASSCYYTLPRADKKIEGASIRLAEICSSFWGNMHAGTRFIANDGKRIIVEGWAWDLEKNLKVSSEVSKSIMGKKGQYSEDMQATTIAAASAIALRNAIFKIVPKIFIEKAYQRAKDIAVNGIDQDKTQQDVKNTFEKRRKKAFEGLERLGVSKQDVLRYYNKPSLKDITQEELGEIIGIGTSIRDGFIKAEEAFLPDQTRSSQIASMIKEDASDHGDAGDFQ